MRVCEKERERERERERMAEDREESKNDSAEQVKKAPGGKKSNKFQRDTCQAAVNSGGVLTHKTLLTCQSTRLIKAYSIPLSAARKILPEFRSPSQCWLMSTHACLQVTCSG